MKMYNGKPYVSETTKYIFEGITKKGDIISLPTEHETIKALEEAGGGLYKNILHKFEFKV
jgi:hypothetical protein